MERIYRQSLILFTMKFAGSIETRRAIISLRFPLGDETVCHRGHSGAVTLI
jgi:hypothetical protein